MFPGIDISEFPPITEHDVGSTVIGHYTESVVPK